MYEIIDEKVNVLAAFSDGKITPKAIKWNGVVLKVDKVNLEYQEREGQSINYYFAINTENNKNLKLKYNNEKLIWTICESWVG